MHSAECRLLSRVTFESPQFTNHDNSIDIADRVGELYEVDSYYVLVMRREEHYVGRRAMVMKVQGRRERGRPKRRWLDTVKDDIKEKGLSADDVYDRASWRRMSSYIDPT